MSFWIVHTYNVYIDHSNHLSVNSCRIDKEIAAPFSVQVNQLATNRTLHLQSLLCSVHGYLLYKIQFIHTYIIDFQILYIATNVHNRLGFILFSSISKISVQSQRQETSLLAPRSFGIPHFIKVLPIHNCIYYLGQFFKAVIYFTGFDLKV